MVSSQTEQILKDVVEQQLIPGAVLQVKTPLGTTSHCVGNLFSESDFKLADGLKENPLVTAETIYDLGELTSCLTVLPILGALISDGACKTEDQAIRFLSCFSVNGKSAISLADLLQHQTGLPEVDLPELSAGAFKTAKYWSVGLLKKQAGNFNRKSEIINQIVRSSLSFPPGEQQRYSRANLIILGEILQSISGSSLQKTFVNLLVRGLDLQASGYIDLIHLRTQTEINKDGVAPTGFCPVRKKLVWGEVRDPVAWAMGGVAGHAGLFSSINDVSSIVAALFDHESGSSEILPAELNPLGSEKTSDAESSADTKKSGGRYLPGGWLALEHSKLKGCGLSEQSFGVSSSTGCALWIDPGSQANICLLSNVPLVKANQKKFDDFLFALFSSLDLKKKAPAKKKKTTRKK